MKTLSRELIQLSFEMKILPGTRTRDWSENSEASSPGRFYKTFLGSHVQDKLTFKIFSPQDAPRTTSDTTRPAAGTNSDAMQDATGTDWDATPRDARLSEMAPIPAGHDTRSPSHAAGFMVKCAPEEASWSNPASESYSYFEAGPSGMAQIPAEMAQRAYGAGAVSHGMGADSGDAMAPAPASQVPLNPEPSTLNPKP
jgi:hypothetical protein